MTLLLLLVAATSFAAEAVDPPEFGGVGLQVVPTIEGDLVVLRVVENSPASQSGLAPGDLIFRVDDHLLKGSEFGRVVADHLWGPVGSSVVISYRRPGVSGDRAVTLQRVGLSPQLTVTPAVQDPTVKQ